MRKFDPKDAIRDYLMLACPGIERDPEALDLWTYKTLALVEHDLSRLTSVVENAAWRRNNQGRPAEKAPVFYCEDIEVFFPSRNWLSWDRQSAGFERGSVYWNEAWWESEVATDSVQIRTDCLDLPTEIRWFESRPDNTEGEDMLAVLVSVRRESGETIATYDVGHDRAAFTRRRMVSNGGTQCL